MNQELKFFSWKKVFIILLLGIGILLLIPKIIGLKQTLELLKQVKYWAFGLALLSESFFYIGSTLLTRAVLRMTSDKLKFSDVLRISLLDSFSLQFLPLGSFGEAAVDYYFLKEKNVRTSHIVLMFIGRTIIIYLIFTLIFLIGVGFSPTSSSLNRNTLYIVLLIFIIAFSLFLYLISLYFRREILIKRATFGAFLVNKILRIFHKRVPLERIPHFIDKFYSAMKILAQNRRLQLSAFFGALIFWAGDIFCLYFSLLGFGYRPHLPMVIFAYTIARVLALISFIPGGLGMTEGALALIFIGFGIPASIALAGVLIFRFISFWLTLPVGLGSFLSLQKKYIKMKLAIE